MLIFIELGSSNDDEPFTILVTNAVNMNTNRRILCGDQWKMRRKGGIFAASMALYIYQRKEWPRFRWDARALAADLGNVHFQQGKLLGKMQNLGFPLKEEASLRTLTEDIVRSSEIEGEILDPELVRSSIARKLGMDLAGVGPSDRSVEGVVEMMLDATQQYERILTAERLCGWQASLFPTGYSGTQKIVVGGWRNNPLSDPMRVMSGMIGKEKVHFEAPASALIPDEMDAFLEWFNNDIALDAITKAAIAHFWFVTIHPFEDGNGRIARAITDLQLARADQTSFRFYSMSAQIRKERNRYYNVLEQTQRSTLDITPWLQWFYACLNRAIAATNEILRSVIIKARFWDRYVTASFNERQKVMLNMIFDGYEGKITSYNWSKKTGVSLDTAVRDIKDLVEKGILEKGPQGGRSTNYILKELSSDSSYF
jgi:Fic family protein